MCVHYCRYDYNRSIIIVTNSNFSGVRHQPWNHKAESVNRDIYNIELAKLQLELVKMQAWVKKEKAKIIIIFEGRDAAGKGGVIKRITERVSPRIFRVVALPPPSEKEKTQFYMQRYISQFPAGGEVVIFDRSWYNRAGVERVMGFCTDQDYQDFLCNAPILESAIARSNTFFAKYFLDVSQKEQKRRFMKRIGDPMRQWKLSPMDLESYSRWWDYTKAISDMMAATNKDYAPWHIVNADDKKRARLNCISHLLSMIPYEELSYEAPLLPEVRETDVDISKLSIKAKYVPEVY